MLWLLINETVLIIKTVQVYLWAWGHEDWSPQSFGCHINPIQTSGRQIMPTICLCPRQVLKATGVPEMIRNDTRQSFY
jgi:hypothetical protein